MLWLYELPTWLMAVLIILVFLVISIGGLLTSRHFITNHLRFSREINDAVNYFGTAIAALYSVTLGLIAVASWSTFSSVGTLVSQEAANLGVLYRDVAGYPEPLRTQLRQELRAYTVFIIEKVWPPRNTASCWTSPPPCSRASTRSCSTTNRPRSGVRSCTPRRCASSTHSSTCAASASTG